MLSAAADEAPPRPDPRPLPVGPAGARIVSIEWERVQVVVRLRSSDGALPGPERFALERAGGRTPPMPPTHSAIIDGDVVLWFNVMLGPGLHPLEPGVWTLTVADAPTLARRPLVLVEPDATMVAARAQAFTLRLGLFTVTPRISSAGALTVRIAFDEHIQRIDKAQEDRATGPRAFLKRRARAARREGFQLLVRFFQLTSRRNGRRILFTTRLSSFMAGNLRAIHDRLVERGLDDEYELVQLFKPGISQQWSRMDAVRLARSLATADVILLDDSLQPVYSIDFDPEVRIIQLWHASGALKTVGYSRAGKPGDLNPFSRVHKNYTHAIVSSEHDRRFYAEAFGIPEERVVPTGIPRMDRFFDERLAEAGRAEALEAYPAIEGRTTILFAPTYRGETIKDASYAMDLLDYDGLHALCVEKDAVVIIRMHPFIQEPVVIPEAYQDRIIDGSTAAIDVNDLLFAVDLLITDYSSIVFEYSVLGRPMLFFAYDLDDYVDSRDFYVPFESFAPGRIVKTFPEVLDAIRRDDLQAEKVATFAERHFAHLDGSSTDRVIDDLILGR
jgi:CDP-ribitol ribitolphosphotransferase